MTTSLLCSNVVLELSLIFEIKISPCNIGTKNVGDIFDVTDVMNLNLNLFNKFRTQE